MVCWKPSLRPFKTLILPNIAALSDAQCQQLRDFVQRGGSVVATYETSLYDGMGCAARILAWPISLAPPMPGGKEGPMQNSYLPSTWPPLAQCSSIGGGAGGGRTHHQRRHVLVVGNARWRIRVTLIPSYPDLPMEMVWPRVIPEIPRPMCAGGRRAGGLFPWDIDRTFWEVLCVDHGVVLTNAWIGRQGAPDTRDGARRA